MALDLFEQAEEAADTFSPEALKADELARAKRGQGYVLIEIGQLDKAEAKYRECLAINHNDSIALQELEYIKRLRGGAEQ